MPIETPRIREEVEDLVELAEERAKKSMKVLQEFKEFAVKGNVVDMAVGIIIGGAFGTIVKSAVDDIIMPPISVLLNGVDFKQRFVVIKAAANGLRDFKTIDEAQKAGAVTWNYGNFLNNILTFLIVAFAVFLMVRMINRLRREEQVAPQAPTDKTCAFCATTIPLSAIRCPHCTSELSAA